LSVPLTQSLHDAIDQMLRHNLREIPVTDESGRIVGFLDERDITSAYLAATTATPSEK